MPRFGVVPLEPPRQTGTDGLAPGFARKLDALLAYLRAKGCKPIVAETLRTPERVEWLHGMGRDYDDGRGVVTHVSDPSVGWHPYGLAADLWDGSRGNPWDLSAAFTDALRERSEQVGLTWGGNWQMKDLPHVQWAPMRATPSTIAQSLYRQGAIPEVWRIVGADT